MGEIRVGRVADFPANSCRVVALPGDQAVLVINLDGELHALEGRCGHGNRAFEVAAVVESEGKILCPWHGWELDLDSGICSADPTCALKRFAIRQVGEDVMISPD